MGDEINAAGDNAAQIEYWNDKAGGNWTRFQERLDALFEPITAVAVAAAAPAAGEHVIDVGCGCGASLLALAPRVGPNGSVLGLDVSEPMSALARERVAAAGLGNARVVVGDAASCALPTGGADLLFSRFGVMFFADPTAAFAHLRGGLRPGGRLLFAVWRDFADNDWFRAPLQAARALLPEPPASDPLAPGPFALADRDRALALLEQAGWKEPDAVRRDVRMPMGRDVDLEKATELAMTIGPLARAVSGMAPEDRRPVRDAVREALRAYASPEGFVFGGSVWLLSARA